MSIPSYYSLIWRCLKSCCPVRWNALLTASIIEGLYCGLSCGLTVFDRERQIKQQENNDGEHFHRKDVPRPGAEIVQQAGGFGLVGDEQVVAAKGEVDEVHKYQVNVSANQNPSE